MGAPRSHRFPVALLPLLVFAGVLTLAGILPSLVGSLEGWGELAADPRFLSSFAFSLWVATVSSLGATIAGLLLSLAIYNLKGAQRVFAQVYRIPLILPHLTVAFLTLLIWTPSGFLASGLHSLGLLDDPQILGPVLYSGWGWGIILTYLLKETPFIMVLVLASLGQMDSQLVLAARNLGAGRWQIFRQVFWPQCFGSLQTGFIIIFLYSLGAYEVPFLVGESYPPMVSIQLYGSLFKQDPSQRAKALAFLIVIFVFSLVFLYAYFRASKKAQNQEDT